MYRSSDNILKAQVIPLEQNFFCYNWQLYFIGSRYFLWCTTGLNPRPPSLIPLHAPQPPDIICEHNISFLSYADDTQLYLPLKWNDPNSCETLRNCLKDIKCWMSHSFLQLNESKTQMVIFRNSNMRNHFDDYLHDFSSNIKPSAWNLGVLFDSELAFEEQVKRLVQSCLYQLRNISKLKSFFISFWLWGSYSCFYLNSLRLLQLTL